MDNLIKSSRITNKYTSTGRDSGYQVYLHHKGLDEHKHLSAAEYDALLGKIHNQSMVWEAKWEKELLKKAHQSKEESAKERTEEAQLKIQKVEKILSHTLQIDDAIDWETLKHKDEFKLLPTTKQKSDYIQYNERNGYPEKVVLMEAKAAPQAKNFFTQIGLIHKLFGLEKSVRDNQKVAFDKAIETNKIKNEQIQKDNINREEELKKKQEEWENKKIKFEDVQNKHNEEIERLKNLYEQKDPTAITEYCEMVLSNSEYVDTFPRTFDLQYNGANGMLLIDYQLPTIDNVPSLSHVKYVKAHDEITEKYLSQVTHAKLYDLAIYQIALRTLHELFEADKIDALSSIVFNGLVSAVNPATGHEETSCIISLQATKSEFEKINLAGIVASQSYKECFKSLKGVGSAKLSTMTAIKPIIEMDKSDRRFRDHYEVASSLNEELNIAAMDWEDFEHLVRELFAKEFTTNGGEVRVTQASADGGVDAIAFDPDPIRGGKIVIQAKRYTNVVGVSAVRDLYGTVMNEGATKGVLVTTSDYGADSYAFAKNKPLTLLNGSNLLSLLEKHGHKAKIDIREAKRILKDQAAS